MAEVEKISVANLSLSEQQMRPVLREVKFISYHFATVGGADSGNKSLRTEIKILALNRIIIFFLKIYNFYLYIVQNYFCTFPFRLICDT